MKKKIVGIITLVCVIAVAVFLLTGKKETDVVAETPVEETVEEATEVDDVETDEEVATEATQESESIVESETIEEETKEEIKEETSIVDSDKPVESTEVQEVYSADQAPTESHEETVQRLEEAGLDIEIEDTTQMTPEEVQAHNQAVYDELWGNAITNADTVEKGNSVGITIE